ncbi:hypothetical protein [Brevibacillus sp. SAFN-007a]|uniref:hypothetical protein n=1 Tax=Brevibacillus sp. SAFN-007a TaxID=3436862 RepID=UPI003F806A05
MKIGMDQNVKREFDTRTWETTFEANFAYEKLGPSGGFTFRLTPTKTKKLADLER